VPEARRAIYIVCILGFGHVFELLLLISKLVLSVVL
jgi:hypothetical protein